MTKMNEPDTNEFVLPEADPVLTYLVLCLTPCGIALGLIAGFALI
jgi:hypothetical protein